MLFPANYCVKKKKNLPWFPHVFGWGPWFMHTHRFMHVERKSSCQCWLFWEIKIIEKEDFAFRQQEFQKWFSIVSPYRWRPVPRGRWWVSPQSSAHVPPPSCCVLAGFSSILGLAGAMPGRARRWYGGYVGWVGRNSSLTAPSQAPSNLLQVKPAWTFWITWKSAIQARTAHFTPSKWEESGKELSPLRLLPSKHTLVFYVLQSSNAASSREHLLIPHHHHRALCAPLVPLHNWPLFSPYWIEIPGPVAGPSFLLVGESSVLTAFAFLLIRGAVIHHCFLTLA